MSGNTGTDDRRSTIIRAVWQVIAEQGMEAVSMRTVAAAAAVSVGRIQYRFRTKDELLRASLEAMLSGAAQLHADATEGADDRAALLHLIGHPIPQAEGSEAGVALFHQYVAASINHPPLASRLAEAKDGQEREAARLLRKVAPDLRDPRCEARLLVATADGLAMRVLMSNLPATEARRALRAALDRITSSEPEGPDSPGGLHVTVPSATS